MSTSNPPKALLTDVFGTIVDWRTTVTRHLSEKAHEALNSPSASLPTSVRIAADGFDWGKFADEWRMSYYQFTSGYDPALGHTFKTIDVHHCEVLPSLLRKHGLEGLWDDIQIQQNSLIWHFLDPWPDSSQGLARLNQKFETATLSNGNNSLLVDLSKHGKLPYKHIISAEDFEAYKPHPSVYDGAAEKLGLQTHECALIAAHLNDLEAAKGRGYQTIYVERRGEERWDADRIRQAKEKGWVDMWVKETDGGLEEVAKRFGL